MRIALAVVAVIACGKSSDSPSSGSATGSASPKPGLHAIAKFPAAVLIAGSRRVAIDAGDAGWFEPAPGTPREVPATAAAIAKLRRELGGDFQVFLGAHPIAVGGEDHHEAIIRLEPVPRTIALDGHLAKVSALDNGVEVWQFDERLRAELAVVDKAGLVTTLPALELISPTDPGLSPMSAKACAAPKIPSLASTGTVVFALLIECNPNAPIRIATYRGTGPNVALESLESTTQLGFEPKHIVARRDGTRAIVGAAAGKLWIGRVASDGKIVKRASLADVRVVVDAALAGDGAVWALTLSVGSDERDVWQVSRDGEVVFIADPAGTALRPAQLAFDERYGVVVIATAATESWLLIERMPETVR